MADLSKTIEILFNATDNGVAITAGGLASKIGALNDAVGEVAEPLANLADKVWYLPA